MPGLITPMMPAPQGPSQGLMIGGAIGQGLSSFADAYLKSKQLTNQQNMQSQELDLMRQREAREAQQQQAQQQQQQGLLQLRGAEAGYDYNQGTGSFTPTQLTQTHLQQQQDALTPESDYSNSRREMARRQLNAVSAGLGDQMISDDMSAHDIESGKLLEKALQYRTEKEVKQQEFNRMMAMFGQKNTMKDEEDFGNYLNKNKAYTESRDGALGADAMISKVQRATQNKADLVSLPTELANYASRGKRLHTATIQAFTDPNSDIIGKINFQLSAKGKGVLDTQTAASLTKMLQGEKQDAMAQASGARDYEAKNFYNDRGRWPGNYRPAQTQSVDQSQGSPQGLIPPKNIDPNDWAKLSPFAKKLLQGGP